MDLLSWSGRSLKTTDGADERGSELRFDHSHPSLIRVHQRNPRLILPDRHRLTLVPQQLPTYNPPAPSASEASMRQYIFVRFLAAAALVAFGIGIVLLTRIDFSPPPPVTFADLTAPLPPYSEADLAEAMPLIDEIRAQNGGLVSETWLNADAREGNSTVNAYIEFLRREARRTENQAADREEQNDFGKADELRTAVNRLREQARRLHEGAELSDNSFYLDYQRQ
jgi:hypothetical protein